MWVVIAKIAGTAVVCWASFAYGYTTWQTRKVCKMTMEILGDDQTLDQVIGLKGKELLVLGSRDPKVSMMIQKHGDKPEMAEVGLIAQLSTIYETPQRIGKVASLVLLASVAIAFFISPWLCIVCPVLFFLSIGMGPSASSEKELERDVGVTLYYMLLWYHADPAGLQAVVEERPNIKRIFTHAHPLLDKMCEEVCEAVAGNLSPGSSDAY